MQRRAGGRVDSAPRAAPLSSLKVNAQDVAGKARGAPVLLRSAAATQSKTRASATTLERQRMNWLNKVFRIAGGFAAAATVLTYALGFGWFSLVAGLPTFIASSVLVPFALVLHDRRLALKKRQQQGKRSRKPRRRTSRPASAVSIETRAPLVERGGRVLAALPTAPH